MADDSKRVCFISNPYLLAEIDVHTPSWWERCGSEVRKYNSELGAVDPAQNPVIIRYVEPSPLMVWGLLLFVVLGLYWLFRNFVKERSPAPVQQVMHPGYRM